MMIYGYNILIPANDTCAFVRVPPSPEDYGNKPKGSHVKPHKRNGIIITLQSFVFELLLSVGSIDQSHVPRVSISKSPSVSIQCTYRLLHGNGK